MPLLFLPGCCSFLGDCGRQKGERGEGKVTPISLYPFQPSHDHRRVVERKKGENQSTLSPPSSFESDRG